MDNVQLRPNIYIVEPNGVYDIEDAARYYNTCTRTVTRWINKKLLRAAKPCGKIMFKGQWLIDLFDNKNILIGKDGI